MNMMRFSDISVGVAIPCIGCDNGKVSQVQYKLGSGYRVFCKCGAQYDVTPSGNATFKAGTA